MIERSVSDIEGPWLEPELNTGVIQRCRENWSTPVTKVSNHVLATFIRQRIALSLVIPEAKKRIERGYTDGTELYDEELDNAVSESS